MVSALRDSVMPTLLQENGEILKEEILLEEDRPPVVIIERPPVRTTPEKREFTKTTRHVLPSDSVLSIHPERKITEATIMTPCSSARTEHYWEAINDCETTIRTTDDNTITLYTDSDEYATIEASFTVPQATEHILTLRHAVLFPTTQHIAVFGRLHNKDPWHIICPELTTTQSLDTSSCDLSAFISDAQTIDIHVESYSNIWGEAKWIVDSLVLTSGSRDKTATPSANKKPGVPVTPLPGDEEEEEKAPFVDDGSIDASNELFLSAPEEAAPEPVVAEETVEEIIEEEQPPLSLNGYRFLQEDELPFQQLLTLQNKQSPLTGSIVSDTSLLQNNGFNTVMVHVRGIVSSIINFIF